jgi:glycosyltransferase involved in cell wall biosynthesis
MASKVTVILPAFNAEKHIEEAIESVLNQTFTDLELLIIDDGSNDGTGDIVKKYKEKDQRVISIISHTNEGVVRSLNKGLEISSSDFIARIDADDIWTNEKLERQMRHLNEDEDLYMSATAKININDKGEVRKGDKYPQIFEYQEIKQNILKRNIFCHSSVVFRRDILNTVGYYNESFVNSEDYEYWIRIIDRHRVEILPDPMVFYRLSKDTISYNRIKEQRYYAIKAKRMGRRLYRRSFIHLIYTAEDLLYILIPDFIYRLRKNYRNL